MTLRIRNKNKSLRGTTFLIPTEGCKIYLEEVTYPGVEFFVSDVQLTFEEANQWGKTHGGRLLTLQELIAYRTQLSRHLGGMGDNYYWSSTDENSKSHAWYMSVNSITPHYGQKDYFCYAICVRVNEIKKKIRG
jgi:hypothetical protein